MTSCAGQQMLESDCSELKHYLRECSRRGFFWSWIMNYSECHSFWSTRFELFHLKCVVEVHFLKGVQFFRCLIECRDEYKYNVEAVELLIRNHLVNMQQYDLHLAQVKGSCSFKGEGCTQSAVTSVAELCLFCVDSPWRMAWTTWLWHLPCSW